MTIQDAIANVRRIMKDDPALAVSLLKGLPEVEAAGLDDLVWCLASERWGCHVNDVKGVLEMLEHYLTSLD